MWIYIIAPTSDGPCKVGITTKPRGRLRELQVGNHTKLDIFALCPCDEAKMIEAVTHRALAVHKTTGEWFAVTVEQAWRAVVSAYSGEPAPPVLRQMPPDPAPDMVYFQRNRAKWNAYMRAYRAKMNAKKGTK